MNFPSKLIEDAVNEFASLPGIGKKTALRLVLHLLKEKMEVANHFSDTIKKMRNEIRFCKQCHNVADGEFCSICISKSRDQSTICVVENIRDLIAIESTQQFNGVYHLLGGIISPLDGIGPDNIQIDSLIERVKMNEVKEIIMALNPTIEGDTTVFYISKKLSSFPVHISSIARGIAFGSELEYTDEVTLARSIERRLPYENQLADRS